MKKGRGVVAPALLPPGRSATSARSSEAEADAGDHLVPVDVLLVVRIAILDLDEAARADRLLDAASDAEAVEILARAGGRAGKVVGRADAAVGVARLGVKERARGDQRTDAAADIE